MSEILVNIFFYIISWWVVLFAVLPWGVRRVENPAAGHDPGAPEQTHLKAKLITTSLIALVLWAIGFLVIRRFGLALVDFRNL